MYNIDNIIQYFASKEIDIDPSVIEYSECDAKFVFHHATRYGRHSRGSIHYRVWGDNIITAKFVDAIGHELYLQATLKEDIHLRRMIKLHKRFMQSGRNKILRNYEKGMYGT